MILTIPQLARAVATALEDEVLPHFEARSWPASRVRSSLGLLQLIIDKAELEANALVTANRLIGDFLVAHGDAVAPAALPDAADPAAIRAENVRLRSALSMRIRAAAEARADGADDGPFRAALHALLAELEALDRPIYEEAINFLPM